MTDQETTFCPFCGTTQKTIHVYTEWIIAYHKDGDKPCRGWGVEVTKAEELIAAVTEFLSIIGDKLARKE